MSRAAGGRLADESNTRILFDHPGATLAHAAILQYRPVNTDVLPIFVLLHPLFAPLLWLLLRVPNVTLGASLALRLAAGCLLCPGYCCKTRLISIAVLRC